MLVHRLRQSFQSARSFTTSTVRQGGHHDDYGGLPGDNLPFSIKNPYALTLKMVLFFGSAAAIPFLNVRHQLLKKK
ncbi:cytochrome c oxidase subunit 7C, mitochondrial-like [Varroa destructor]|uniref:Cytochrome c oxidase subunit 7C, mitochondrial n=1 Tax=Varroa destructor TaxID=109461 RepID=A0A7M7L510_VARDE|nr:cytochrome c oxidase subunit 7C, mitochondrial-like [Varroa destructor]